MENRARPQLSFYSNGRLSKKKIVNLALTQEGEATLDVYVSMINNEPQQSAGV